MAAECAESSKHAPVDWPRTTRAQPRACHAPPHPPVATACCISDPLPQLAIAFVSLVGRGYMVLIDTALKLKRRRQRQRSRHRSQHGERDHRPFSRHCRPWPSYSAHQTKLSYVPSAHGAQGCPKTPPRPSRLPLESCLSVRRKAQHTGSGATVAVPRLAAGGHSGAQWSRTNPCHRITGESGEETPRGQRHGLRERKILREPERASTSRFADVWGPTKLTIGDVRFGCLGHGGAASCRGPQAIAPAAPVGIILGHGGPGVGTERHLGPAVPPETGRPIGPSRRRLHTAPEAGPLVRPAVEAVVDRWTRTPGSTGR